MTHAYLLFFRKAATSTALRVFGHCLAFACIAGFRNSFWFVMALAFTVPEYDFNDAEPLMKYLR